MVKFQTRCRYKRNLWLGGKSWRVEVILETPSKAATCHLVLATTKFSPNSINIDLAFENKSRNK